jgi:phage terminase Nu1 subunit (DNA packaging protein)
MPKQDKGTIDRDSNIITQKEVCDRLMVTKMAVNKWSKEPVPIPSIGSGLNLRYSWPAVMAWWIDRKCRKCPLRSTAPAGAENRDRIPPKAESEARREKIKADMDEVKLSNLRRELVPLCEVEHEWAATSTKIRTQLLSIKNRLLPTIGREHADLVEAEILKTLKILAEKEPS